MKGHYYNDIAKDYHLKRKAPWKPLENFLIHLSQKNFTFKGFCIDLGCANGRNFKLFKKRNNKLIGIDHSLEFLKITLKTLKEFNQYSKRDSDNIQLILGDLNYIPIRLNSIQTIFSIATIHHIKGKTKREKAIFQIFSLLSETGYFLPTVWRKWQKKFRKYFIFDGFKRFLNPFYKKHQKLVGLNEFGDKYIPWTLSKENIIYNRFYHFFSKREIKNLLKPFKIQEFWITGGPDNKDNFFILCKKLYH